MVLRREVASNVAMMTLLLLPVKGAFMISIGAWDERK